MIDDTVSYLSEAGRRVIIDAEHFFDGYRYDPTYALRAVTTALEAGADVVALCDTNGGMLPDWVHEIVTTVAARTDGTDRKSTRLNSSHVAISYAVFCLKKKNR